MIAQPYTEPKTPVDEAFEAARNGSAASMIEWREHFIREARDRGLSKETRAFAATFVRNLTPWGRTRGFWR